MNAGELNQPAAVVASGATVVGSLTTISVDPRNQAGPTVTVGGWRHLSELPCPLWTEISDLRQAGRPKS